MSLDSFPSFGRATRRELADNQHRVRDVTILVTEGDPSEHIARVAEEYGVDAARSAWVPMRAVAHTAVGREAPCRESPDVIECIVFVI
jgi:hypothetical protein